MIGNRHKGWTRAHLFWGLLVLLLSTGKADDDGQDHYKPPDEIDVVALPTTSPFPTFSPTPDPSPAPTEPPTSSPNHSPTVEPTNIITENPTLSPTTIPTESPTFSTTMTPTDAPTPSPSPKPDSPSSPATSPSDDQTSSPTSTEQKEIAVVEDGVAVGLITALGVGGLAVIVTAVVIQRRRMLKGPGMPQVISDVSTADYPV